MGLKREVIVDCGSQPMARAVIGALCLLVVFATTFVGEKQLIHRFGSVVFFTFSLPFIFGRFQICKSGVWARTGTIPWSKFEEYSWNDDGSLSLRIAKDKITLKVPEEDRSKVDDLLATVMPP